MLRIPRYRWNEDFNPVGERPTAEENRQIIDFLNRTKCNVYQNFINVVQRIGSDSTVATAWSCFVEIVPPVRRALTFGSRNVQRIVLKAEPIGDDNNSQTEFDFGVELYRRYPESILATYSLFNCTFFLQDVDDGLQSFIAMELAGGDFKQYMKTMPTPGSMAKIIQDMLEAVYKISGDEIFHGDLHLQNLFVVFSEGRYRGVLGDFGKTSQYDVSVNDGASYFSIPFNDIYVFFDTTRRVSQSLDYGSIETYSGFVNALATSWRLSDQLRDEATELERRVKDTSSDPSYITIQYNEFLTSGITRLLQLWE